MQRIYTAKEVMRARQQSNDTSNSTGTKQGNDKTQQYKKRLFSMEGKLLEKARKLMERLSSRKALSGSKLWAVGQLVAEQWEQVYTCKKNAKSPQRNNL